MERLTHLSPPLPTDPEHRTADPSVPGGDGPHPHGEESPPLALSLAELRASIDQVDQELLAALARRAELARAVARMKRVGGVPPVDPAREAVIVRTAVGRARELKIPDEEVRDLAWRTLALCRSAQEGGRGGPLP